MHWCMPNNVAMGYAARARYIFGAAQEKIEDHQWACTVGQLR